MLMVLLYKIRIVERLSFLSNKFWFIGVGKLNVDVDEYIILSRLSF